MSESSSETFQPIDLNLGHLKIAVFGRQFPSSTDYWDANWLEVKVTCEANGSFVCAEGAILHLSELESWQAQVAQMKQKLSGEARLDCMEPNLAVRLKAQELGQILMSVSITPDHLSQSHTYEFEIDQTYLNNLISDIRNILAKYPVIGKA